MLGASSWDHPPPALQTNSFPPSPNDGLGWAAFHSPSGLALPILHFSYSLALSYPPPSTFIPISPPRPAIFSHSLLPPHDALPPSLLLTSTYIHCHLDDDLAT